MPKASELKRGMLIDIDGAPHSIRRIEAKSPSSRGGVTLYKVRFNNLLSGQKLDLSFKSDDPLKEADCQRVPVQFSYQDGERYHFMNSEDYSQYELGRDELEEALPYISEGLEGMVALLVDERVLAIELPQSVTMRIVETVPVLKGSSATGRNKPARLSSGLEIQVPEYLENGELIRLNTSTGKYMSRA